MLPYSPNNTPPTTTNPLPIFIYAYAILLIPGAFGQNVGRLMAALGITGVIFLAIVADLTTLRFFGAPFFQLYQYLPLKIHEASPAVLAGTAASYVSRMVWLLAAAAIVLAILCAYRIRERAHMRLVTLALAPVMLCASLAIEDVSRRTDPIAASLHPAAPMPKVALHGTDREKSFSLVADPITQPETILVVIVESAGAIIRSSDATMSLGERLIADSGTADWVRFSNAVANSNATDISIPSLLTGSGAHEPAAKLHTLPFLWQYAKAQGYRAEFITSSTMEWGGFDRFLSGGSLDRLITSADSQLPYINDLTVDDHFSYRAASTALAQAKGKLFLLLYVNALHLPFQTTSVYPLPSKLVDRRTRATAIAESGFRDVFAALRASGRLDDALIIVAGDHGEFDTGPSVLRPRARVDTFEGGILSPIFQIKVPQSLPAQRRANLEANANTLVANIDIAPTIAELLGGRLTNGLAYGGYSLLGPVPMNRVSYAVATNEWRHWPRSALAVSKGTERLTCDHMATCRMSRLRGQDVIASRAAKPQDELVQLALANPILSRSLAHIYGVVD